MSETLESGQNEFGARMAEILNHGALNLALAIGYQTGLLDVMDGFDSPQTVAAIADTAELNPRYVQEWLGVMATGGIVVLSNDEDGVSRYILPRSHGDLLTKRSGSNNLGVYTQEIPLLTVSAWAAVSRGFRTGEGVSYDHYPDFQAFMSELADAKHRQVLIDRFLPAVDNGRLVARLEAGIRVCDLGCGHGVALLLMARAFPHSRFIGIDNDEAAVYRGREAAQQQKLANAAFEVRDAAGLMSEPEFVEAFDFVTAFDAIHDQTQPLEALRSVRSMLKPEGAFSMVDIAARSDVIDNLGHPMGPFLYTVSLMHCLPVGLMDGGIGLGMMWGREKAEALLRQAGFSQVVVNEIRDDPFNLHFFCRP